jgi:hypothetical protein
MVNTAGFVFSATASVKAASIIVSTLNISNENFLNPVNNEYKFSKEGNSSFIYNAGKIAAQPGGYVALLSQAINNSGTISVSSLNASIGKVVLAVGERMTVALDDKSQISVVVDEKLQDTLKIIGPDGEVIDSAIKNSGKILAEGGKIVLTAKVLNKIFDYAVNNTGVIQATSLVNNNGVIELIAEGPSPVLNTGTIKAGYIKVSVTGSDFINRGSLYAVSANGIAASGNMDIKAANLLVEAGKKIIADKLINLDVETILEIVYSKDGKMLAASEPEVVNSGEAISAPTVKISMRKLGTSSTPVYIKAANLDINRIDGNIDISESLGIGTSILMRGPPEGFGSFIYSKDSNLTLETANGSISEASSVTISAHDLILIANQNIDIYGTIKGSYVHLNSLNGDTILYPGSVIDVSTNEAGAVGGTVEVFGKQVSLIGTLINASGPAGGGMVLIGGDFQGKDATPNSTNVYVVRDSYINADALYIGNGGKVIVWSDGFTMYHGHISAKGGPDGGNGGFIQVSGSGDIEFNGFVDASASNGTRGTFIMDPNGTSGYAASLATDKLDYHPGQLVTITGSGFQAGEVVSMILHPNKAGLQDIILNATADANGNFSNTGFTPNDQHRGVVLDLNASGQSSGLYAETRFTDISVPSVPTITSTATGGAWNTGGSWLGGVAPADTDLVVIVNGAIITIGANRTCAGITINGILNFTTDARTLTVNGDVSGTGTLTAENTTRGISLTGNWSFNGTSTGAGTVTFTGGNDQTLSGTIMTGNGALTINKTAGSVVLGNAITMGAASVFKVKAGTFDAGEYLLTAGSGTLTAGTIRVGAADWGTNYSFTPTPAAGFTIEYYGANPTISGAITYQNLVLSGAGTARASAALTIKGDLTIGLDTILDPSGFKITGSGTLDVYGTILVDTLNFTGNYSGFDTKIYQDLSTVKYSRSGNQNIRSTEPYYNLTTSGKGTKTLNGDTTVGGDLAIVGSTLSIGAGNFDLTVSGNWSNSGGVFSYGTGTVTFDGTGTSTISGASSTFYDLKIVDGKTLDLNGNALSVNSLDNSGIIIDNTGTVDITSAGNIYVGVITNAGGTVKLTSTSGAILDNNDDDNNITANSLILSAANGIGDDGSTQDAIETQVSNLEITNTDNGVWVVNDGSLTLTDISSVGYAVSNTNGWVKIVVNGFDVDNGVTLDVNNTVTAAGNITLEVNNTIDISEDVAGGDDYSDDSENYAKINVNSDISSTNGGNITLTATNIVNKNITSSSYIYTYDDSSSNYATINVNSPISTNGGLIDILAKNEISVSVTIADGIYSDYYDYSYNYAEVYIYGSLNTKSGMDDSAGTVNINATNSVTNTIDAGPELNSYCDQSQNYVYLYLNNSIDTDLGSVTIAADNSFTRDITADEMNYLYDYSISCAYTELSDAPIYSISGDIKISATNTVDNSVTATTDALGGYIDVYADAYYNYAEVYIYHASATTIQTTGNIDIDAANSFTEIITADSIGTIDTYNDDYDSGYGYDYYPSNYAYLYVKDTLDTRSGSGIGLGAISIKSSNIVTKTVDAASIDYIEDYSYNGGNSDGCYPVELYGYIYTDLGDVTILSENTRTVYITAEKIDGSGFIHYYDDESVNYTYVYSATEIITGGMIDIDAINTVKRTITADSIDTNFDLSNNNLWDYSTNVSEIDIYGQLDTRGGTGAIDINATNSVTNTIGGGSYIYYYYDQSQNYAYLYLNNYIYTDPGSVTLVSDNSFTRDITADDIYYLYDDSTSYAYIYAYDAPIYSISGDIKISATNTVDNSTTAKTDDSVGHISNYESQYENYAYVYDYISSPSTISTIGNIDIDATNDTTEDVTSNDIDSVYFGDESSNYSDIYICDTLDTRSGSSDSLGTIDVTSSNTVNRTVDAAKIDQIKNSSESYSNAEVYWMYADNGGITLLSKNNVTDTAIAANGGFGLLTYYCDESSDYADLYVKDLISGAGNIDIASDNGFTRDVSADTISSFDDYSSTYAQVYIDCGDDNLSVGGDLTLSAKSVVNKNGLFNDYSSNDAEIYIYNVTMAVSGISDMTADIVSFNSGFSWPLGNTLTVNGDLSISGNFDATSGDLDVNGDLSIDGGTFTAPEEGKTFTVSGSWTNSWTFNSGTGTVTFDGIETGKTITSGGGSFCGIAFTGVGGDWTIQDGMKVTDQFKVTDGKFISGANTVTIEGADATYQAADINSANTDWTGGTLIISSDKDQSLPDNETYDNIQLGGYSGSVTTLYIMGSGTTIVKDGTINANAKVVLTISATADDKVYDGTKTATATLTDNNIFSIYVITPYSYTAVFDSKNVGSGKTVEVSDILLTGADKDKFALSSTTASATADVTALAITGNITADNKVYDGNDTAVILTRNITGAVAGDDVSYTGGTAAFDTIDVGVGKTVTGTGLSLSGADAGNYTVNSTATTTADITPLPVLPNDVALLLAIIEQLSNMNAPRYPTQDSSNLGMYQPNLFSPQVGSVYFYHPLTPYDMAAFDAMILNAGAYQFLNGYIDLIGHEGLRSMFDNRRNPSNL